MQMEFPKKFFINITSMITPALTYLYTQLYIPAIVLRVVLDIACLLECYTFILIKPHSIQYKTTHVRAKYFGLKSNFIVFHQARITFSCI